MLPNSNSSLIIEKINFEWVLYYLTRQELYYKNWILFFLSLALSAYSSSTCLLLHHSISSPFSCPNQHSDFHLNSSLWQHPPPMGLFKSEALVYRPVKDVDLGPHSDEFYLQANVKGSLNLILSFICSESKSLIFTSLWLGTEEVENHPEFWSLIFRTWHLCQNCWYWYYRITSLPSLFCFDFEFYMTWII